MDGWLFVFDAQALPRRWEQLARERTVFFRAEPAVRWPPKDGQPVRALAMSCGNDLDGSPAAQTDGPHEWWSERIPSASLPAAFRGA
jgi:hypothetical protein